jgi:hypothetical protein
MGQSPLDNQQRSRPGDHRRVAVPARETKALRGTSPERNLLPTPAAAHSPTSTHHHLNTSHFLSETTSARGISYHLIPAASAYMSSDRKWRGQWRKKMQR